MYANYIGVKFVLVGKAYVNVAAIASVKRSHLNDNQTEILMVNGEAYHTTASVAEVMSNIVDRV